MPVEIEGTTYYTVIDCNKDGTHHYPLICAQCGAKNTVVWEQTVQNGYCKLCGKVQLGGEYYDMAKCIWNSNINAEKNEEHKEMVHEAYKEGNA